MGLSLLGTVYETVLRHLLTLKNLLVSLFLMGGFPGDFQDGKRPNKALGETAHFQEGKRPTKEGKRPINANGQFSGNPPWW